MLNFVKFLSCIHSSDHIDFAFNSIDVTHLLICTIFAYLSWMLCGYGQQSLECVLVFVLQLSSWRFLLVCSSRIVDWSFSDGVSLLGFIVMTIFESYHDWKDYFLSFWNTENWYQFLFKCFTEARHGRASFHPSTQEIDLNQQVILQWQFPKREDQGIKNDKEHMKVVVRRSYKICMLCQTSLLRSITSYILFVGRKWDVLAESYVSNADKENTGYLRHNCLRTDNQTPFREEELGSHKLQPSLLQGHGPCSKMNLAKTAHRQEHRTNIPLVFSFGPLREPWICLVPNRDRGRWISMSLSRACFTLWVPGQLGIQKDTLSQK